MDNQEYYTVKELAALLRLKPRTIYQWIKKDIIPVTQVIRKGAIRIHRLDISSYARKGGEK